MLDCPTRLLLPRCGCSCVLVWLCYCSFPFFILLFVSLVQPEAFLPFLCSVIPPTTEEKGEGKAQQERFLTSQILSCVTTSSLHFSFSFRLVPLLSFFSSFLREFSSPHHSDALFACATESEIICTEEEKGICAHACGVLAK